MENKILKQSPVHPEHYFKETAIIACSVLLISFAVSQNLEVKEHLLRERNKLNVTSNCNESLLIFNRVPKVRGQQDRFKGRYRQAM